jgi:hypothetical protein
VFVIDFLHIQIFFAFVRTNRKNIILSFAECALTLLFVGLVERYHVREIREFLMICYILLFNIVGAMYFMTKKEEAE